MMSVYLIKMLSLWWPLPSLSSLYRLFLLHIVTVALDSWIRLQVKPSKYCVFTTMISSGRRDHTLWWWGHNVREERSGNWYKLHQSRGVTPADTEFHQQTSEINRGGDGEGEGGHNKYMGCLESGYGEDAWAVRWWHEGSVLQCEGLGQSHQLFLQWYHQVSISIWMPLNHLCFCVCPTLSISNIARYNLKSWLPSGTSPGFKVYWVAYLQGWPKKSLFHPLWLIQFYPVGKTQKKT